MNTTLNVLMQSPIFQRLEPEERESALAYYNQAVNHAKVRAVLNACPSIKDNPTALKIAVDFGLSLAEPFKKVKSHEN
jgi:hypothetical protein